MFYIDLVFKLISAYGPQVGLDEATKSSGKSFDSSLVSAGKLRSIWLLEGTSMDMLGEESVL